MSDGRNHLYDDGEVVHVCKGVRVHPGVYLVWTKCHKDVPAWKSFLSRDITPTCKQCLETDHE